MKAEAFHFVDVKAGQASEPRISERILEGDPLSQTLKIVCLKCNGGWMKGVVDRAKPTLAKLIKGDWEDITNEDFYSASAAMVLSTMVYEYYDPRTMAISHTSKEFIRKNKGIPPGFRIFLGRFLSDSPTRIWHRGFYFGINDIGDLISANCQVTIFCIGRLCVQVAYCDPKVADLNGQKWHDEEVFSSTLDMPVQIPGKFVEPKDEIEAMESFHMMMRFNQTEIAC